MDLNAYKAIADKCRISEKTVRNAFSRKPVTLPVAARIANNIKIPLECFRIKYDQRGQNKKTKQVLSD